MQKYRIVGILIIIFQMVYINATEELQHLEKFEQSLDEYEKLSADCVEGFNVLRIHDISIEGQENLTYRDFLKKNLVGEFDEQESNFGEVHLKALEFIWNKVKIPFYTILLDESKKSHTQINDLKDPIFCYVMTHRTGPMAFSIKEIINIKNDEQFDPPLLHASFSGNLSMVKLLCELGADVNIKINGYHCPLCCAIIKNELELVKFLIKQHADVNIQDGSGHLPLSFAIMNNNADIFNLLIQYGADIYSIVETSYSPTLLHIAVEKNNIEFTKKLIDLGSDMNLFDERGSTPLGRAAFLGYAGIAQLLINSKADVNIFEHSFASSASPLSLAIREKHYSLAMIILKAGANPNIKSGSQSYPLHDATYDSNYEMVQLLLESGADSNAKNDEGLTSLHIALLKNYVKLIKLLLMYGADINLIDGLGRTPEQFSQEIVAIYEKIHPAMSLMQKLEDASSEEEAILLLKNHNEKFDFLDNPGMSEKDKLNRVYQIMKTFFYKFENAIKISNNFIIAAYKFRTLEQIAQQSAVDMLLIEAKRDYVSSRLYKNFENQLKKDWR